jgi:RNA polymerase sigma factor (sigma-70 family)
MAGLYKESYNEPELLIRLNKGDGDAFAVIYEKYYPVVTLTAARFLDPEIVHDITAEVFIRIWKHQKQYESFSHLIASLRLMTRNLCIDRLRSDKTAQNMAKELEYLTSEPYEDVSYHDAIKENLIVLVLEEIERLPDYLKQVFVLSYIDGLNNNEIAERLNMKDSTVRTKKSQALDILRTKLKKLPLALVLVGVLVQLGK